MGLSLKEALEKANCATKTPEMRLAFSIGYLMGAIECSKVKDEGAEDFLKWAEQCNEEFMGMISQFDSQLVQELTFSMKAQRN